MLVEPTNRYNLFININFKENNIVVIERWTKRWTRR